MSKRRVSLEALDFDSSLRNFLISKDDEEEQDGRINVKKILRLVIKNELTARQKQIIMLYYYEGKTQQEIADKLEINVSTVSRTLNIAKKKIFNILKYYYML